MYMHYYQGTNALSDIIMSNVLNVRYGGDNPGLISGLNTAVRPVTPAQSGLVDMKRAIDSVFDARTDTTGVAVVPADYTVCLKSGGREWPNNMCTDSWKYKMGTQMLNVKDVLSGLDNQNYDLFNNPNGPIDLKLVVLLGDKARSLIDFPYYIDDIPSFVLTMFADSTMLYKRSSKNRWGSVGSLTCPEWNIVDRITPDGCLEGKWDVRQYEDSEPLYNNVIVNQPTLFSDTWTTLGLYALPGKPFTVIRTDNGTDAVRASILFWYQRYGVVKSLELRDDGLSGYNRPMYHRSHDIWLPPNTPVTISTPIGGPMYLNMQNRLPDNGANSGAYTVTIRFDGVAKHAALLDMGNNTAVQEFADKLYATALPVMDMRGDGLEVHARKDKLFNSLKGGSGTNSMVDYSQRTTDGSGSGSGYANITTAASGIRELIDDYRYRFVEFQYLIAGFKPPGKSLKDTLPKEVIDMCAALAWPCLDEQLHRRWTTQHSNYDDRANCGSGCSGNPWDADWDVTAIGWGESHELGHNMQIQQTSIGYPVSGGASINTWSSLSSTSGENSNNIFPFLVIW